MAISRRRLLGAMVLLATGPAWSRRGMGVPLLPADLLPPVPDTDAVAHQWLSPGQAGPASLERRILALIDDQPAAATQRLRRRVRDDFAAGRVVRLHGWLLSETEACLCGLRRQGRVRFIHRSDGGGRVSARVPRSGPSPESGPVV